MKVVFDDRQNRHDPKHYLSSGAPQANPEVPERATRLLAAAVASGLEQEKPDDYGIEALEAVHTDRYLHFLEHIYPRWQRIPDASNEVFPNIHPDGRDNGYPASAVGQVGFHVYDASCPITADTWEAARWSANTAIHAAHRVLDGARACYALSRPPGHHAGSDLVGGFCYLNNAAIATEVLLAKYDSVAILDVDVHHGNGTQDIFYERDDVLTVSIHADPTRFYPFFWGYAGERGSGDGIGANLNLPLLRGTGDDDYLKALDKAMQSIDDFEPGAIVVALGLDASERDPFKGFDITTAGFGRIGQRIAAADLPTLLVQEGGYLSDVLGDNLAAFLDGFTSGD